MLCITPKDKIGIIHTKAAAKQPEGLNMILVSGRRNDLFNPFGLVRKQVRPTFSTHVEAFQASGFLPKLKQDEDPGMANNERVDALKRFWLCSKIIKRC